MDEPPGRPPSEDPKSTSGWSEDVPSWPIHAAHDHVYPPQYSIDVPAFPQNPPYHHPNNQAWWSGPQAQQHHYHENHQGQGQYVRLGLPQGQHLNPQPNPNMQDQHLNSPAVPVTSRSTSTYYIALVDSQSTEKTTSHKMLIFRKGDYLLAKQTNGGWYWGCVQGKETEVEHGYFNPNQVESVGGTSSSVIVSGNVGAQDKTKICPIKKSDVPHNIGEATYLSGSSEWRLVIEAPSTDSKGKASRDNPTYPPANIVETTFSPTTQVDVDKIGGKFGCRIIPSFLPGTEQYDGKVKIFCARDRAQLESAGIDMFNLMKKILSAMPPKDAKRIIPPSPDSASSLKQSSIKSLRPTKCFVGATARGYGRRSGWSVRIDCPACMDSVAVSLALGFTKGKESIRIEIEKKFCCTMWKTEPLNGYKSSGCVVKVTSGDRESASNAANYAADLLEANAKEIGESKLSPAAGKRNREAVASNTVPLEPNQKRVKHSDANTAKSTPDTTPSSQKWSPPRKKKQKDASKLNFVPPKSNSNSKKETTSKKVVALDSHQKTTTASKTPKRDLPDDKAQPSSNANLSSSATGDDANAAAGAKQSQSSSQSYIQISTDLAKKAKFPPECPVVLASSDDRIISGFIRSVLLKLTAPVLMSGKSTYNVCYKLATEGNFVGESSELPLAEESLQFASKCPILIPASFAPPSVQQHGCTDLLSGSVVSSYKSPGEKAESYVVTLTAGGGRVSGVPRESVMFRPTSWKEPKPSMLQSAVVSCNNTSKQSEPPVAIISTADDTSKVSEVSSPPSPFGGANLETSKRLNIPPCINFESVKKHLYGDGGDIRTRISKKLGVNVHLSGNDLLTPVGDKELESSLTPPLPNGNYSGCILLKGTSKRIAQAVKVVVHILVEKVYEGNEKDMVRRQIFDEDIKTNANEEENTTSSKSQWAKGDDGSDAGNKTGSEDESSGIEATQGIFGGFALQNITPTKPVAACPESFSDISSIICEIAAEHGPMRVGSVNVEFKKKYGRNIDYEGLGYQKLIDLVKDIDLIHVKAESYANYVEYMVSSKVQAVKDSLLSIVSDSGRRLAGHEPKTLYEKKTGSELDLKKLGYKKFKQLIEDIPSLTLAYSGKNQTTMHVLLCYDGQK